jgi:hypothetical protein
MVQRGTVITIAQTNDMTAYRRAANDADNHTNTRDNKKNNDSKRSSSSSSSTTKVLDDCNVMSQYATHLGIPLSRLAYIDGSIHRAATKPPSTAAHAAADTTITASPNNNNLTYAQSDSLLRVSRDSDNVAAAEMADDDLKYIRRARALRRPSRDNDKEGKGSSDRQSQRSNRPRHNHGHGTTQPRNRS